MSAGWTRGRRVWLVLTAASLPGVLVAQDTEPPPADLLEYLGSWQEDDEEWFVDAELEPPAETEDGEQRKRVDDDEQE